MRVFSAGIYCGDSVRVFSAGVQRGVSVREFSAGVQYGGFSAGVLYCPLPPSLRCCPWIRCAHLRVREEASSC